MADKKHVTIMILNILVSVGMMSSTLPTFASCFENLGQTGCPDRENFPKSDLRKLSCENLWLIRNSVFDENGYCFKTARAQSVFDNSDCSISDASVVKLNNYERKNIDRILEIEREMDCR